MKRRMNVCAMCRRKFYPSMEHRKYCSDKCAGIAKKQSKRRFDLRLKEVRLTRRIKRAKLRTPRPAEIHVPGSVFSTLATLGHDIDFTPMAMEGFTPTNAMPGTSAKIAVLTERIRSGQPPWHPQDCRSHDEIADFAQ